MMYLLIVSAAAARRQARHSPAEARPLLALACGRQHHRNLSATSYGLARLRRQAEPCLRENQCSVIDLTFRATSAGSLSRLLVYLEHVLRNDVQRKGSFEKDEYGYDRTCARKMRVMCEYVYQERGERIEGVAGRKSKRCQDLSAKYGEKIEIVTVVVSNR